MKKHYIKNLMVFYSMNISKEIFHRSSYNFSSNSFIQAKLFSNKSLRLSQKSKHNMRCPERGEFYSNYRRVQVQLEEVDDSGKLEEKDQQGVEYELVMGEVAVHKLLFACLECFSAFLCFVSLWNRSENL
eukprot:GFUD01030697.1.p1 GENE.GFUD01030697.1~~GFUD01030697.1.p1  ORF type:complete len:130 (+),score=33.94 GFUD01030697.1:974-1363(+)